jgi:hypothetical protein
MEGPKAKRKHVMTPEHRAKVLQNLEKARLAPQEKVYRKTERRYAANLKNLAIGHAKRRQEAEALRAKMEATFPAPASSANPESRTPNPCSCHPQSDLPGATDLARVTRRVGQRLRKVKLAVQRESRRIMQVLTAALGRSRPLNVWQAIGVAFQLMDCLENGRTTDGLERLNRQIKRLLLKMIVARYGPEPPPPVSELERRWMELLERMRREAREEAELSGNGAARESTGPRVRGGRGAPG